MDSVLFLGTGSSVGVPVIACNCITCTSSSPFNKRLRSSILVNIDGKALLVDASPDLREQSLRYKIEKIDGVLFTHAHYDHTGGIDDLRIFHFINKKPLQCLTSTETAEDIKKRYYYMFKELPKEAIGQSRLCLQLLPNERGTELFENVPISYFSYYQLEMKITGFRFKNLAYVTDLKSYPESIFQNLSGLDTLIVSALRYTATPMHLTVDEAVDFAKKVGAKKTWLIHMAHELEYEKTNNYLPEDIRLAYDGLKIHF